VGLYNSRGDSIAVKFSNVVSVDWTRGSEVNCFFFKDWGGVVGIDICDELGEFECPDLLILGTTQVAKRVADNEIQALDDFFLTYLENDGIVLSDDFLKVEFPFALELIFL